MSSDVYCLVHKWTIDNFGHFYREDWNFDKIESSKFYLSANKEDPPNQFHLRFHPNGEKDAGKYKNNVAMFLYRSSVQHESAYIRLQISIIDVKGDKRNTRVLSQIFDEKHDHFGFGHYIRVVDLLEHSNEWLPDDKLTLLCELHVNGHGQNKDSSIMSEVSESHSNARPQVALSLAHKWTIDGFGNFYSNCNQRPDILNILESQKFHSPFDAKHQFSLRLYPNGFFGKFTGRMLISLQHRSIDQLEDVSVLWKVSILDLLGEKVYTQSEQNKFTQKLDISIRHFLSESQRLAHSNSFRNAVKLDLFCEIKILTTEENYLTNYTSQMENIFLSNPQNNPSHDSVHIKKCAHKWTIHNFSSVLSNESSSSEVKLVSCRFSSCSNGFYLFNLLIIPSGHDEEGRSCVSLQLNTVSTVKVNLIFKLRISLIGANGSKSKLDDSVYHVKFLFAGSSDPAKTRTISHDELCQQKMLNDAGSITFYCEIDVIENWDGIDLSEDEQQSYFRILANRKLDEQQLTESVTNAIGKKVKVGVTWELENFVEMCARENGTASFASHPTEPHFYYKSPIFSRGADQHRFYISLYPNGTNKETQNYLSLALDVLPTGQRQVMCEYSISLLDSVGFKYNTQKGKMRFDREGCGWPDYLSHEKLFNPANELLKDNKLVIDCEVEFVEEEEIDDEKQNKTNEIVNFVNPNKQTDVTPTHSITQVSYITHRWTIDNFGYYFQTNQNKRPNSLECSKFSPVNDDQLQFVFKFIPKPFHENEQFTIFFDLISEKRTGNLSTQLIISVLNENDMECASTPCFPAPHSNMANGFPLGRTTKQFNWKDTQMDPKSIKQLKLLFQYQISTHYSSVSEMREIQQSCEEFAIPSNLSNDWKVKRLCDVSSHTQAVTSIPVESCTYEWRVPNFSSLQEILQSNTFSTVEHDFFLRLNNNPHQSDDTILIYLCLAKSVEKATKVCLKISILDKNGHKFCTKENLIKLFEGELQYECVDKPFDKRYFTSNGLLLIDTLRIFVELNLVGEPTCNLEIQAPIRILPKLKPLLFNCPPIDMFTKFDKDGIVYFHIAVLSAGSKVFEEMFNRLRDKKAVGNFPFMFDVTTFEVVLRFIYTGQIYPGQLDHVFAEKLLIIADMYQIGSLMAVCENVLLDQLETAKLAQNIQQSVKYLVLADKHDAKRLKERCIKIVNQYAPIIRETSAWNALLTSHPNVVADLYKNLMTNRKSKSKEKVVAYSVK